LPLSAYEAESLRQIESLLWYESDFNCALEGVIQVLEKRERWRSKRRYFLTVVEILRLHSLHKHFWGS
jgi:hypothetical protein